MANQQVLPAYIPELDGLRFVAVTAVILFHLSIPGFGLGWAGVNLFFVISGFLITGILLDTRTDENYYRNFYARRALRIFPIYYILLAVVILEGHLADRPMGDLPFYLFYLQNYVLGFKAFKADFPSFFNHTWSLAIEEQFYLVWPFLLRLLDRKKLLFACFLLFGVSLLARFASFVLDANPYQFFAPLPTQMDGLVAGAAWACLFRGSMGMKKLSSIALWAMSLSFACILGLLYHHGPSTYWLPAKWTVGMLNLFLFSLLAIFFSSLLSFVIMKKGILSLILSTGWLRHVGKISYGLYLYHFPVLLFLPILARRLNIPIESQAFFHSAVVLTTYLVAVISWKTLESRMLALKRRFQ